MQREVRFPCPKKDETHIGYFDVHARQAIDFGEVLKFQKKLNSSLKHIIIGGDFLDCSLASKWNERYFKHVGFGQISDLLLQEFAAGKKLLNQIRETSPDAKLWYIPGNHENWLFLAKFHFPQIEGIPPLPRRFARPGFKADFESMGMVALSAMLEQIFDAKSLGMTVLPYKGMLTLGKITYMHGDQFANVRATPKIFPTRNIVYGHHHTHHVETLNDGGVHGSAVQHVGVPCMTKYGPGYLESGSTRWLQGFWLARVAAGGLFDGSVVKILGGKKIIY